MMTPSNRIISLDYLRGLMAIMVMCYHYYTWSLGEVGADSVLGRLGIYAVSTFFVLSGLSLAIVYRQQLSQFNEIRAYLIKRLLRIAPLLWFAVSFVLMHRFAVSAVRGQLYSPDILQFFLNYSLLYGFIDPSRYIATGSWSIGNEMVFYTLFPFIVFTARRNTTWLWTLLLSAFAVYCFFAFYTLNVDLTLAAQWKYYINPFNQLFLFVAGTVIGLILRPQINCKPYRQISLLVLLMAFIFYPCSGDLIHIVTGAPRIVFSILCILVCAHLYLTNPRLNNPLGRCLQLTGDLSYGIYLLHPLVAIIVVKPAQWLGLPASMAYLCIAVPTSFLCAYASYQYIEKPAMRYAAKLIQQRSDKQQRSAA